MNIQLQQLIEFIETLDIAEKDIILERLENEDFSEELFEQIDSLLASELTTSEDRIKEIKEKETETDEKLKKVKEENAPKKKELQVEHRANLKKIFDKTIIETKQIAGEIDQEQESTEHSEELNEAEGIRKKLGI